MIPWGDAKVATFVLKQQGHSLIRAGFIQVQKRPRRPEYDINLLAPALDTPSGHPAIWEKLLSYTISEAAHHQIERIYVDVPDQPLPVTSFAHVGFRTYARQTIWRLRDQGVGGAGETDVLGAATIRPAVAEDEWALQRLYAQVTPGPVQQAECGVDGQAPILYAEGPAACGRYVLMEDGEITGALHLLRGQRGTWLSIWTDTLQTDCRRSRQLLCFGLKTVQTDSLKIPVYVGVSDYHGGLSVVLDELGFAPFTDRAKMVKHILARVREGVPLSIPAMESIGEVVTSPYISRQDSWHQHSSHQSARNEPRHSAYVHNELVGKSENYAGTSTR